MPWTHSSNSSKPPSSEPYREKSPKNNSSSNSVGQQGYYKEVGYETRKVVVNGFKRVVTEYQAQILENQYGKPFVVPFPEW
jgi:transposase